MWRRAGTKIKAPENRSNHVHRKARETSGSRLHSLEHSIGNNAIQRVIRSPFIQTKLYVSTPSEPLEQEADDTADKVMRMREPSAEIQQVEPIQEKSLATAINPRIQRTSTVNLDEEKEETIASRMIQRVPLAVREDDDEEQEGSPLENPTFARDKKQDKDPGEEVIHRKSGREENAEDQQIQSKERHTPLSKNTSPLSNNIQALKGCGSPLPDSTRAFFEPRFGADFGQVRVHTDSRASETTNSLQARALTVGQNIAFGAGQYAPESTHGKELLAHELVHTIQQTKNTPSPAGESSPPSNGVKPNRRVV